MPERDGHGSVFLPMPVNILITPLPPGIDHNAAMTSIKFMIDYSAYKFKRLARERKFRVWRVAGFAKHA
jgi:hypothetical protein